MDTVQLLLLCVVIILTILLVALGIQVYFILKSLRGTIARANKVLDNTELITESVSAPLNMLGTLLAGKNIIPVIIKLFGAHKKHTEEEK